MDFSSLDSHTISGSTLNRRVKASVSEGDAFREVARNPDKFKVPNDSLRPNMLKARDAALTARMSQCSASDTWVREIIAKWCEMSGLSPADADFWREKGFMEAVKDGRDLNLRRFLDEDGWAWIVVRDSPSHWLHRKRLPESTRQRMVAALAQKTAREKRW